MAGTLKQSMSTTRQDFNRHIAPILHALWAGCQIHCCEGMDDPHLKKVDEEFGIDYLIMHNKWRHPLTFASRIQRTGRNYKTFTIRSKRETGTPTEFEKRSEAIKKGRPYPKLTMQAYLSADGENFLSMAIAKTIDVYDYLRKYPAEKKHTGEAQHGQAEFLVVRWSEMIKKSYGVRLFTLTDGGWDMVYTNDDVREETFLSTGKPPQPKPTAIQLSLF